MSSNFPTTLDNSTTIPVEANTTKLSVNHVINHTNVRDMIIALETKVGVDGSAVTTTHDYKLSEITASDKAVGKTATQTLTNKTLTSATLTTPVINVGSDATGDIYYRNSGGAFTRLGIGTNTYILTVSAGIPSWAAQTTISNASTTVAGVVEEATQAEVDAGTSTGGTGARLFVNPSTLAVPNAKSNFTAAESITAGQPVTGYYYQSDGGITFDNKGLNNGSVTSAGGTVSFSFTVGSGSNRVLCVFVNVGSASGTVPTPTVTYNSVSMTAVDTQAAATSNKLFSFILTNPTTGANNVVITLAASAQTNFVSTAVMSYANSSGLSSSAGATTNTVSYGTPALGAVLVSASGNNPGSSSVNNNTNTQAGTANSFSQISSGDSGVAHTSTSATVTFTAGTNITIIGLAASTAPAYGAVVKSSSATPSNGVNLNKYTTFAGFAATSASAGASIQVITDGIVTGLTLTSTLTYFLADTAGTIATTAGTNSKKIGFASSTSVLVLKDTI